MNMEFILTLSAVYNGCSASVILLILDVPMFDGANRCIAVAKSPVKIRRYLGRTAYGDPFDEYD